MAQPSEAPTIRRLHTLQEMVPIELMQTQIWGYGATLDAPHPYPARALFEFAESGGLILGAYKDGGLVGFSAAWLGRKNGELYLHSQLLGMDESLRNNGLGARLKREQAVYAREQKLERICWTFDPLQTKNGYLNFGKLGATSGTYLRSYLGDLGGKQNGALATDRLWVEWLVNAEPRRAPPLEFVPIANVVVDDECIDTILDYAEPHITVQVPENFNQLREHNLPVAKHWQQCMREIFDNYLPQYRIIDAVRRNGTLFYVLKHGLAEE